MGGGKSAGADSHLEQSKSSFVTRYEHGVQDLYVHGLPESPPRLYKRVGSETSPRELAQHDGPVLYDGEIVDFVEEDRGGLIGVYHGWMGRRDTVTGQDSVKAVKLEEVEKP